MNDYSQYGQRRLYRSTTDRVFMGVCGGLAKHLDFPPGALRLLMFILIFWTGILPGLVCYVIAGLVMKPEPTGYRANFADDEFYRTAQSSPSVALHRIQTRFDQLDKRLQKMEDFVTSDRGNLEEEFRKLQREA